MAGFEVIIEANNEESWSLINPVCSGTACCRAGKSRYGDRVIEENVAAMPGLN